MYYVCLEQKLLSGAWTTPHIYTSHRERKTGEVTGGEVQRAVPKSARCWGIHVTWGDSMILWVPIMPLICFIDWVHTSEPEFFLRAKPEWGHWIHRSCKPALNPHGGQCHTHVCLWVVFVHQKLNQRCRLKAGKRTLGNCYPGSKTEQTYLETRNAAGFPSCLECFDKTRKTLFLYPYDISFELHVFFLF